MTTPNATAPATNLRRLFADPLPVGRWTLPPIGLVVLAALGAMVLLVVAGSRWSVPNDEHAYWLAGQRLLNGQSLYDPNASSNTPFAYWYPPVVAQVMAPISAVVPSELFSALWTVLLLGCLMWLAGGRPLVFLALFVFLPVATELGFRNVHLVLAVIIVLAIRRWPALFAAGAAIKFSPGLGIIYLAAGGRWRQAVIAAGVGLAILGVSFAISPSAWSEFFEVLRTRGPSDASSLIAIPYWARAILGLALTIVAARISTRWGEPLLVVALVVALPTLWFTALSTLTALVPILRPASSETRLA